MPNNILNAPSPRKVGACLGGIVLITTLAACGSGAGSTATADGTCGELSSTMPKVGATEIAALPGDLGAMFRGYTGNVYKSAWADWKPSHPAPYKIGIVFSQLANPGQVEYLRQLEAAAKTVPGVSDVTTLVTNTGTVTQQLQQYDQLVRQGVDLILTEPLAPAPFKKKIDDAAARGIPTVVAFAGTVDTPNAINIDTNLSRSAQEVAAQLASSIDNKGNILVVRGVQGYTPESMTYDGFTSVFKNCPDIKVVGSVVGNYSPSVAKSEVLKFLGTHPAKIDAVAQIGTMGTGIVSAFEQSGREVPPMTDPIASAGALAYWNSTPKYKLASVGMSNYEPIVRDVLTRMINGNGPKISSILIPMLPITRENLSEWVQPGWKPDTEAAPVAPESQQPSRKSFNGYFVDGGHGLAAAK